VRYRRSKKMGPFRFTVSNRGVSTSVGAGPFRVSYGADGKVRRTIRIPNTGFYDTRVISQPHRQPRPRRRAANVVPRYRGGLPSAGWYPDPAGSGGVSYWDGTQWTMMSVPATYPQRRPTPVAQHPIRSGILWGIAIATAEHPIFMGLAILIGLCVLVAFWKFFVAIVLIGGTIAAITLAAIFAAQRHRKRADSEYQRKAALAAHADYEHHLWMQGDPRGFYGQYPPTI
jgi:hypothetical protein